MYRTAALLLALALAAPLQAATDKERERLAAVAEGRVPDQD